MKLIQPDAFPGRVIPPGSIHPQGWVLIETRALTPLSGGYACGPSSIHPQGWVPIETIQVCRASSARRSNVAFTPKGGCPLKLGATQRENLGWLSQVAFTPKGGCLLKHERVAYPFSENRLVAFTPKGGCLSGKRL